LWGTLAAVCAWGISAAVFTNTGRTIFQEQASSAHRARVLSVYMFGFMGASGLIGAPLAGVLAERIGPLATCATAGGVMLAILACTFLFTNVARME
jgi:MFS family permease